MDLGLKGKTVFVTGGSKGIGFACAKAFCDEGARVAISSRSIENLEKARRELEGSGANVFIHSADFTSAAAAIEAVAAAEAALGPIEVLTAPGPQSERLLPSCPPRRGVPRWMQNISAISTQWTRC